MINQKQWIGGYWVDGCGRIEVTNKYSGEVIGSITTASVQQVDEVAHIANAASKVMAKMPIYQRADILLKASQILLRRREEFAKLISAEAGKALKFSRIEVDRACNTFMLAGEEARQIHGETVPMDAVASGSGFFGFWQRRPVGVVGAITPFNFPLNLVAHKVAPALAAGNAIILKPAEVTPLTAGWLAEVLHEAGLPAGAFNVIHGLGEDVGDALIRHPLVPKITFTGSPRVGALILAHAGIKKVTLELGNAAPVMICADADLDVAAQKCAVGSNYNSGQVCVSTQRIYVEASVADAFVQKLKCATEALKVGDPLLEDVDVGPIISTASLERIDSWVKEAVSQGATIITGGYREGSVYRPTLLENTSPQMKVICQEVFAPVVSIIRCPTFEDALLQADDTQYGLQAAVFTQNINRVFATIQNLNFGGVVVNDLPSTRPDHIPYGGNRQSGLGREGLRFAIEEMTNLQMVMIRTPHTN